MNDLLKLIFHPINDLFTPIGPFWWKASAVGLFLATIVWVFTLRKEYVNLDAPKPGILYDLRLWTVVALAPHIFIYFWFNR